MAAKKGLEPSTFPSTGGCSKPLSYMAIREGLPFGNTCQMALGAGFEPASVT